MDELLLRAAWLRPVWETIAPPDPGQVRTVAALRITLAGLLTMLVLLPAEQLLGLPVRAATAGVVTGVFACLTVHDTARRDRLQTTLLCALPPIAACLLAALVAADEVTAGGTLVAVVFLTAWLQAAGARPAALAMTGFMAFFIGLVMRPTFASLPGYALAHLAGAACAALARFVLLRERPFATLRRMLASLDRLVLRILGRLADTVAAGAWTPRSTADVDALLDHLHEATVMAADRAQALDVPAAARDALCLGLFELELATERIARLARHDPVQQDTPLPALVAALRGAGPPPPTGRVAGALAAVATARRDAAAALQQAAAAPPHQAAPHAPPAAGILQVATVPAAAPAWRGLPLHMPLQAAVAAAISIGVGDLVSPPRWYWAAVTAFLVFTGTHSRGETLQRGVQYTLGTFGGALAGMLVAALVAGQPHLSVVLALVAVFLAYHASAASYGMMVFWFTVVLGLLFSFLDAYHPGLLLVRLEECAAGSAVGIATAALLLPVSTVERTRAASLAALRDMAAVVQAATRRLTGEAVEAGTLAAAAALDRRLAALRGAAAPLVCGWAAFRAERFRRNLRVFEVCVYWTGELARQADLHPASVPPALAVRLRARAANLAALVAVLPQSPPAALLEAVVEPPGEVADPPLALVLLRRLDEAVRHLSAQLAFSPRPRPGTIPAPAPVRSAR